MCIPAGMKLCLLTTIGTFYGTDAELFLCATHVAEKYYAMVPLLLPLRYLHYSIIPSALTLRYLHYSIVPSALTLRYLHYTIVPSALTLRYIHYTIVPSALTLRYPHYLHCTIVIHYFFPGGKAAEAWRST